MRKQLMISILFLSFIACRNEFEDHETSPDYMIIDTSSVAYTRKANLNKVVYASLFGSYLPSLKIDLNNDSTDDLQFSTSVYHHTVYDEWTASVSTLHDGVKIDTEQQKDIRVNYSMKFFDTYKKDSITVYYKENFNKNKIYPANAKTDTLVHSYPEIHSIGDTVSERCNWNSGSFILEYDDHSWGVVTNISLGTWRDIDRKFIGIRFFNKGKKYYGWIELGVSDYRISLYKHALKVID